MLFKTEKKIGGLQCEVRDIIEILKITVCNTSNFFGDGGGERGLWCLSSFTVVLCPSVGKPVPHDCNDESGSELHGKLELACLTS